jgi:hypothetical protein
MSLTTLFGGVEPIQVVLAYAATLSIAGFIAALAILVSTLSQRSRDASVQIYVLELAWLFGPALMERLLASWSGSWLRLHDWIATVNDVLRWSSPYFIIEASFGRGIVAAVLRMAVVQTAFAAVFVLAAIVALRPVAARDSRHTRRIGRLAAARHRFRILVRPAVGSDPMFWKECCVARSGGMIRFVAGIVFFIFASAIVFFAYRYATPAFVELLTFGYSSSEAYGERKNFNVFLRAVCTLLYVAWSLEVASLAAAGVTGEREEDTWISLISSPLSGEEILRAKMLGSIWGARGLGLLTIALWCLGLAAGAVHPAGFAAVVIETAIFIWFAAALGVTFSLSAATSARAQAATIGLLATANGLYFLCCVPLGPDSWYFAAGITPLIEAISLLSYEQIAWLFSHPRRDNEIEAIVTCILSTLIYGAAALVLTTKAFVSFDARVDRPRRDHDPSSIRPKQATVVSEDHV